MTFSRLDKQVQMLHEGEQSEHVTATVCTVHIQTNKK